MTTVETLASSAPEGRCDNSPALHTLRKNSNLSRHMDFTSCGKTHGTHRVEGRAFSFRRAAKSFPFVLSKYHSRSNRLTPCDKTHSDSITLCHSAIGDSSFHYLLHQRGWYRLVIGEVNRSLGRRIAFEFFPERFDHCPGRKQAAVIGKSAKPHQHFLVLERRNSVADNFD